jgi:hypothetical protein
MRNFTVSSVSSFSPPPSSPWLRAAVFSASASTLPVYTAVAAITTTRGSRGYRQGQTLSMNYQPAAQARQPGRVAADHRINLATVAAQEPVSRDLRGQ